MSEATVVELRDVRLRVGDVSMLDGVDLALGEHELLAVTGPSGSGKTTLARIVLGLVAPGGGTVRIGDWVASEPHAIVMSPEARRIGAVFQDLALWPHLTVHGNLAFGLPELARDERELRIAEMLQRVGLADKARRRPGELSGGERQRVAIARALVLRPRAVVLDEPLANLDVVLAAELLALFRELLRDVATIFITHDPHEAAVADRIAVLEAGRITQTATWDALRANPATPFIKRFVS